MKEDQDIKKLPKDWDWVKVSSVAELYRGISYTQNVASSIALNTHLPILRANNINGELNYEDLVYVPIELIKQEQLIRKGDILFAMSSGSKHLVGKSAVAKSDFKGSYGAFCGMLRIKEQVNKQYIAYIFKSNSYRKLISEIAKGTNINNLKREHILNFEFPLPPLPIQHAIVSKIEGLFSELDKSIEQLKTAQQQLKTYRQAILKWAFEGRFTNKNIKEGELPEGWTWKSINEIGKIKGGKRLPPKHQYSEEPTDYIYIMAGNLKQGTVVNKPTYIKEETYNSLLNYKVSGGEVYITIVGACIGDAGIIPNNIGKSILTENAAKIIDLINVYNKYLAYWINSTACQSNIKSKILSATLGKLALNRIGMLDIPIPKLNEQERIVEEIESRLSVADKMEESIEQSLQQAEVLRQSILKKAFEGKLVESDTIETIKETTKTTPVKPKVQQQKKKAEVK